MRIPPNKHLLQGATFIEMIAAVLLVGLAITGVAQYVLVSKLNVHMTNIKSAVLQELSDKVIEYQNIEPTDAAGTNIVFSSEHPLYIDVVGHQLNIRKTLTANHVYEVKGQIVWKTFPYGQDAGKNLTETVTLEIPE